ncbi:MAG: DNA polymerase III subunit gamma/tau [Candidatus Taylorbacteria bacterium]
MPVLYRTYRPSKWSDVVGQNQVVSALKDAITSKHVAHAYLFSGSRGTGKTSVARIFARALDTKEEDVYEIDAASNRGIDDIRHLREHVSVLPFSSTYKVYIIDEVHMLSKDAWNALLKTLEEPPKHVIFILATTELEKVPETIVSRCQAFFFRRPSRDIVRVHVIEIAKKEGFSLDAGAADLIALLGDGSFRDALGTLEKVIASSPTDSSKKAVIIKRVDVENITGAPKAEIVNSFIEQIITKDADKALATIGKAIESGLSMNLFLTLVLEKMRFILLMQNSASSRTQVQSRTSEDDFVFISAQAGKKLLTVNMLSILLQATIDTSRASIESLPLELAVVAICV